MVQFRALMNANGDTATPLWVTELGWATDVTYAVTEQQKAEFITQWLIDLQALNIPVAVIYDLQGGDDPGYGLVNGSDVPNPAYYAVQQLVQGNSNPRPSFGLPALTVPWN